jgi:hypothetical protein
VLQPPALSGHSSPYTPKTKRPGSIESPRAFFVLDGGLNAGHPDFGPEFLAQKKSVAVTLPPTVASNHNATDNTLIESIAWLFGFGKYQKWSKP